MTTQTPQVVDISVEELVGLLEPLIRRVIREELLEIATDTPDVFYLDPDSPLYEDLEEIIHRKERDDLRLYSHKEVWGE